MWSDMGDTLRVYISPDPETLTMVGSLTKQLCFDWQLNCPAFPPFFYTVTPANPPRGQAFVSRQVPSYAGSETPRPH